MDSVTRIGCKLVLNEVFEGEVQGFIERAEGFFAVLPPPDSGRELSEHSPLYDAETQDAPSDDDAKWTAQRPDEAAYA